MPFHLSYLQFVTLTRQPSTAHGFSHQLTLIHVVNLLEAFLTTIMKFIARNANASWAWVRSQKVFLGLPSLTAFFCRMARSSTGLKSAVQVIIWHVIGYLSSFLFDTGVIENLRCFTCINSTISYDRELKLYHTYRCNFFETFETCSENEVC